MTKDFRTLLKDGCYLWIVANGFKGQPSIYNPMILYPYPPVQSDPKGDRVCTFKATIFVEAEQGDKIKGSFVFGTRKFKFNRTRPGDFVQEYTGWLFEKDHPDVDMAGTFSHNGVNEYGWYGGLRHYQHQIR
jgi:hypothetical protein